MINPNFSLWHPKYSTNEVLLAKRKIIEGINYIEITKSLTHQGKIYAISKNDILKCPLQKNKTKSGGEVEVYAVPIIKLNLVNRI